jgi:hypothetical protein
LQKTQKKSQKFPKISQKSPKNLPKISQNLAKKKDPRGTNLLTFSQFRRNFFENPFLNSALSPFFPTATAWQWQWQTAAFGAKNSRNLGVSAEN